MTFDEWFWDESNAAWTTQEIEGACCRSYVVGMAQSQARLEKLGLELLEQHAKAMLAETLVAELAAEVAMLREALIHHQKLTRPIDKTMEALTATSDDWLRRHDADVLRNAAGKLEYGVRKTMADQLCDMADELEGDKK